MLPAPVATVPVEIPEAPLFVIRLPDESTSNPVWELRVSLVKFEVVTVNDAVVEFVLSVTVSVPAAVPVFKVKTIV